MKNHVTRSSSLAALRGPSPIVTVSSKTSAAIIRLVELTSHLHRDVSAEGPAGEHVRAMGMYPSNRRQVRRGQLVDGAKR